MRKGTISYLKLYRCYRNVFLIVLAGVLLFTAAPVLRVTASGTDVVYVTNTGKKYHRDGCKYLEESRIPILSDEAAARGYTACAVCLNGVPSTSYTYHSSTNTGTADVQQPAVTRSSVPAVTVLSPPELINEAYRAYLDAGIIPEIAMNRVTANQMVFAAAQPATAAGVRQLVQGDLPAATQLQAQVQLAAQQAAQAQAAAQAQLAAQQAAAQQAAQAQLAAQQAVQAQQAAQAQLAAQAAKNQSALTPEGLVQAAYRFYIGAGLDSASAYERVRINQSAFTAAQPANETRVLQLVQADLASMQMAAVLPAAAAGTSAANAAAADAASYRARGITPAPAAAAVQAPAVRPAAVQTSSASNEGKPYYNNVKTGEKKAVPFYAAGMLLSAEILLIIAVISICLVRGRNRRYR